MNRIIFYLMDWMTDGALTDLKQKKLLVEKLQMQLAGCSVAANGGDHDLSENAYGWSPAFGDIVRLWKYTHGRIANLETQLSDCEKRNANLVRMLGMKQTQVDQHVSLQQRIFDLEFRLKNYERLDKQIHAEQRRKTKGVTGESIGLKKC